MKKINKKSLKKYLPLVFMLAIFCVLYAFAAFRPIWFDEAYSAKISEGNLAQIWNMTALDVHPPLYYWLLHGWGFIFGHSLFVLRSLSIVFAILTLACLFFLFKRWSKSDRTALILTACFGACPFFLFYSVEMRMYTLVTFAIAAGTLALDYALETNRRKYWILYGLIFAVALYTHYFSAFAFLAHAIYLIFYFRKNGFNKNILLSYAVAFLIYLPWIPSLIGQVTTVERSYWIEPLTWLGVSNFFSYSLVFFSDIDKDIFHLVFTIIGVVLFVILAIFGIRNAGKKTRNKIFLLLLLAFVPPITLIVMSLVSRPVYLVRYIIPSMAFLWVLYGLFILIISRKSLTLSILAAFFMLCCFCIGATNIYRYNGKKSDVKEVVEGIRLYKDEKEKVPIINGESSDDTITMWFYDSEEHPFYAYNVVPTWYVTRPITEYKKNYIPDIAEFLNDNSDFWYISKAGTPEENTRRSLLGDKFEILTVVRYGEMSAYRMRKIEK